MIGADLRPDCACHFPFSRRHLRQGQGRAALGDPARPRRDSPYARRLGLSRNSIVGKLHRIGLRSIKSVLTKEKSTPRAARRNFAPINALFSPGARTIEQVQPAPPLNDAEVPLTQRRTLVELGNHDCRWSCGDPDASDFFFCGAPAVDGFPTVAIIASVRISHRAWHQAPHVAGPWRIDARMRAASPNRCARVKSAAHSKTVLTGT
jgi:hypothetical protein